MTHSILPHRLAGAFTLALLLGASACSTPNDSQSSNSVLPTSAVESALNTGTDSRQCYFAEAGHGWLNTFIPAHPDPFSMSISAYPGQTSTAQTVDAVFGLSNGPADAFSDLGPIVRFNADGNIDARNGDHYEGAIPYSFDDRGYEFRMDVNLGAHRYDVWLRPVDTESPFELLANNFAFRTEQGAVARLDNIGRFIDEPTGWLNTCRTSFSPTTCSEAGAGTWTSQAYPAQSSVFRIEVDATPSEYGIDAVVGASLGPPTAFTKLGPIVRFRPDDGFDARNGSVYAADTSIWYSPGVSYRLTFDIDMASHTYSATVASPGGYPVPLAHDYAFRTEQANVASLDRLGQFVDGGTGSLALCSMTVAY